MAGAYADDVLRIPERSIPVDVRRLAFVVNFLEPNWLSRESEPLKGPQSVVTIILVHRGQNALIRLVQRLRKRVERRAHLLRRATFAQLVELAVSRPKPAA
jgi:hypothetical protein